MPRPAKKTGGPPPGIPPEVLEETEAELDKMAEEYGQAIDDFLEAEYPGEKRETEELSQEDPEGGQAVADRIVDTYTRAGAAAMKPTVEHLLSAIETSTSPADLRTRLETLYKGLDSDALTQVVQKALMLAELDGRWAVLEE